MTHLFLKLQELDSVVLIMEIVAFSARWVASLY